MQVAPGSISWVAAQPSVLGRCGGGGGAPSASVKGRAFAGGGGAGGGGGGGCVRGVGLVRCSARAQEKRPPRVRKSKEERREMVESFINSYRIAHHGKFPSVNLTHKEVGGSYYIVREIVRDVIQENRVLGPGGLDSMALSFEDCPDSSEVSVSQDNIEGLAMSDDGHTGQGSVSESSSSHESFSLQNNSINAEILLGSSNILEAGVLKSVVQNRTASATSFLETNLEKQDEFPSGGSIEVGLNSSEEKDPLFSHSIDSDKDKDIALNSQEDAHEGLGSVATDILFSESADTYETNGALLREHETLPNDGHGGSNGSVVDDGNLLAAANGVLQENQASFQEHDPSNERVQGDIQSLVGQISTAVSASPVNGFDSEAEVTTKTTKASDPEGLLHTEDQHSVVQIDGSKFKKSTSGFTKEEVEATDASHEQGMSTRTVISRKTLKAQQKKYDNLFWLVLRAFVVAISKIWAK